MLFHIHVIRVVIISVYILYIFWSLICIPWEGRDSACTREKLIFCKLRFVFRHSTLALSHFWTGVSYPLSDWYIPNIIVNYFKKLKKIPDFLGPSFVLGGAGRISCRTELCIKYFFTNIEVPSPANNWHQIV